MEAHFEPVLDNCGFDASASPDWMMLPLKEEQPLWLVNGSGLTVSSTVPAIAEVRIDSAKVPAQPTWQLLRLKGKAVGRAFIELRSATRVVRRLEVSVKPRVTLSVSFHLLSDSAKKAHATLRTAASLAEMMRVMNSIYTPQTNIAFELKRVVNLKMAGDLGDAVNYNYDYRANKPMRGHEYVKVTDKRDASAHINVFCVWKNEFVARTASGQIETKSFLGYSMGGRDIMIEDWDGSGMDSGNSGAWENGRMLAHEMGHILGIDDVGKTRRVGRAIRGHAALVVVNANYVLGSGPFIPKNHANIMSAIARQIAGR